MGLHPTLTGSVSMQEVFANGGQVGALLRAKDWARTPLGPVEVWPQSLRTAVGMCLAARMPLMVLWGPEYLQFYNDEYSALMGSKHPAGLGQPAAECWPEILHYMVPLLERTYHEGQSTWRKDQLLPLWRCGYLEEAYFTIAHSPIRDEQGRIGGILHSSVETTLEVIARRRLNTLGELARQVAEAHSHEAVCEAARRVLEGAGRDVPLALLYLREGGCSRLRLRVAVGLAPGGPASPQEVHEEAARAGQGWPLAEAAHRSEPLVVEELSERFGPLRLPEGRPESHQALVVPLREARVGGGAEGYLVLGASAQRPLDEEYRRFFRLVAHHVGSGLAHVHTVQVQRERAERLAELDRAKTVFFSNVSHELRTPLTLMLGPLEELRQGRGGGSEGAALDMALRNARRLLKLVNTLLEFARIEAGRVEAAFEPLDLGAYTADLASMFRSVAEKAGLRLEVDSPPLSQPVWVDRGMWERVVMNLLSNAVKFTLRGCIGVRLREARGAAVLEVSDTGTGIAEAELPRLFERFHQVRTAEARSQEGTGIGLALVQELVRLHRGRVEVASRLGQGSTFTVHLPLGTAHVPAEQQQEPGSRRGMTPMGTAYVEEALRWLPEAVEEVADPQVPVVPASVEARPPRPYEAQPRARLLVADDNADMRAYLCHLLSPIWQVEAVADGAAALEVARQQAPDLVLADVMMPRLGGFELLRALRAEPRMRLVPVLLLSARAGEEALVEGLQAGADDYLVKPFSARELRARVRTHLELARLRQQVLSTQEEVLAMVAHDVRSPLSAILAAVRLLSLSAPAGEAGRRLQRHTRAIQRQAERIEQLVQDLLDISRAESGHLRLERQPERLGGLLCEAVELVRPLAEQKRLRLTCEELPLEVVCDAKRILQVLSNLLGNAIKFTPEGGSIRVVGYSVEGGQSVRVEVQDTGPGIPREALPHIFERHYQVDPGDRRGVGLGLTIARGLVEAHGGQLWAESQPGRGSTFIFTLPQWGHEAAGGEQPPELGAE